jgi:cation diffusion facilitator family transporter
MTDGHEMIHGKQTAATNSVLAAFGLTGFKIVIALTTGSIGILAEAAHSGLDMLAALMTVVAVRLSGKPADREHRYGHGKFENLSALFETVLLLITCIWIITTAVRNVIEGKIHIEVTFWSFLVMAVSILIDVSRSRMLYRAAKKYNSQALEADALHFRTDIWSSSVVILGLFCVKLHDWLPGHEYLHYADTVAAVIVALIATYISFQLGTRTIAVLLDAAPGGLETRVTELVEKMPGVLNCHHVRIRCSGPDCFIDLHINVDGDKSLRKIHDLTEKIEAEIKQSVPNADVTVHPEPA